MQMLQQCLLLDFFDAATLGSVFPDKYKFAPRQATVIPLDGSTSVLTALGDKSLLQDFNLI